MTQLARGRDCWRTWPVIIRPEKALLLIKSSAAVKNENGYLPAG